MTYRYLDFAGEQKKLWNVRLTVILIIVNALGKVPKVLKEKLEGLEESRPFKLQHCWDRPEFWEESRTLEETCYHSDSSEKPLANADRKTCNNYWIFVWKSKKAKKQLTKPIFWQRAKKKTQTNRVTWNNGDNNGRWCIWNGPKVLKNSLGELEIREEYIVKISKNTKKSPGDMEELVIHRLVKNYCLKLV